MPYRIHFTINILSLFVVSLLISVSQAQDTEESEVREVIQKLTERLDHLEKDIVPRLTEIEKQMATVFAEKKLDTGAKNACTEINALVGQSKFDDAKVKVAEFMKNHAATTYASGVVRFQQELNVIGKESPKERDVEK